MIYGGSQLLKGTTSLTAWKSQTHIKKVHSFNIFVMLGYNKYTARKHQCGKRSVNKTSHYLHHTSNYSTCGKYVGRTFDETETTVHEDIMDLPSPRPDEESEKNQ